MKMKNKSVCGYIMTIAYVLATSISFANPKNVITPHLSYEWESVLEMGDNSIFLSVEDGAPCNAQCKVYYENVLELREIDSFQQQVQESSKVYENTVNFPATGSYIVACNFTSNVGVYDKEINLFISEQTHPITGETNSPRKVGNDFIVTFDFGSWKQIEEIVARVYFEASYTQNGFILGEPHNIERKDSFDNVYVTHSYKKAGLRQVRIDISSKLPDGKKFVQLLFPITIVNDIEIVQLTAECVSLCSLSFTYNISKSDSKNVTTTFPYQANMKVNVRSKSLITNWIWKWGDALYSERTPITILLSDYMRMHVTVGNAFSEMIFTFDIQYDISVEDIIVAMSDILEVRKTSSIVVVYTSFDTEMKIAKAKPLEIAAQITHSQSGSVMGDYFLTRETEKCYDDSAEPLKNFLADSTGFSKTNYRDGIKIYCVRTLRSSFYKTGSHDVLVTAIHQGNKYKTQHRFCVKESRALCSEPIAVKIRGVNLNSSFEADQNIFLFGEYFEGSCSSEPEYQLVYSWMISKIEITVSEPLLIGNEREFFIPGKYMALGEYNISLTISKEGYCGDKYETVKDEVKINTYRPHRLMVKIKGGPELILYVDSETNMLLESEETATLGDMRYKWYCYAIDEEEKFASIYGTSSMDEADIGGCSGEGFLLSKGLSRISTNGSKIEIKGDLFKEIPGKYKIRLSLEKDNVNAYDDLYIELRKASSNLQQLLELNSSFAYHPSPDIECITNCGEYLDLSSTLHLKADCKTCENNSASLEIRYQWTLHYPTDNTVYSLQIHNWKDHSYTNLNGFPENIRLKTSAFRYPGLHKMSVTMASRSHSSVSRFHPVATAFRYIMVAAETQSSLCYISPSVGQAAITNFEIRCPFASTETAIVYEMFHSDCHECDSDDSYELFHRGYSGIVTGLVLPAGEEKFGYKLTIKIVRSNVVDGKSSDAYIFVKVMPLTTVKSAIDVLESSLQEGSALSKSFTQKDAVRSASIVSALLSAAKHVNDEKLLLRANEVILRNLKRIKNKSVQTFHHYTAILKKVLNFMSIHIISKDSFMVEMTDTISEMTNQISSIVETDDNRSEESTSDMFSVIGSGLRTASLMPRYAQTAVGSLSSNFAKLIAVYKKPLGEYPTIINDDSIHLALSNSHMVSNPTGVHWQQYGVALTGVGQKDITRNIKAGVATFSFNPMFFSSYNKLDKNSAVVGLVLAERNSSEERDRQDENYLSQVRSTVSIVRGKRLHILLPPPKSKGSTSIRLPRPCSETTNTSNAFLKRSTSEACGFAHINFSSYISKNERYFQNDLKKGESYATFHPSRACRIPSSPCIEFMILRQMTASQLINHNTIQVEDCSLSQTSDCMLTFEILQNEVLPIHSYRNRLPEEFTNDSWSVFLNDVVIDSVASEDDDLVIIIRHLQKDFADISEYSIESHLNVTMSFMNAACLVWNSSTGWQDTFCGVGRPAVGNHVHCECDMDEVEFGESNGELNTIYFAANLVIAPNSIDFEDIVTILLRSQSHYYVLAVVLFFWLIFLFLILWARRDDSIDDSIRDILIPVDMNISYNYLYEVVISTAVLRASGTSAKVQIILEGADGTRTDANTISTENLSTLQRAGKDSFLIAAPESLGRVNKVHLWHDNGGEYPSWHLDRIAVFDLQNKDQPPSYFLINSWLSQDIHPFRCHLTANRSNDKELFSFRTMWKAHALSTLSESDVWLTTFFKPRGSQFTRMRRVDCLASAFFGTMLVTNMFVQAESQYYSFNLGFAEIDLSPLIIAIQSVVLVAPLNILLVFVFTRIETREEAQINRDLEQVTQDIHGNTAESLHKMTPHPIVHLYNYRQHDSTIYRVQECNVITMETESLRSIEEDNYTEDYESSEDEFDIHETLSKCLEIRKIAQEITSASKDSYKSTDEKRRIKVRIIDDTVPAKRTYMENMMNLMNSYKRANTEENKNQHVWYKRFRAKRILRGIRRKNDRETYSNLVKSVNDKMFLEDEQMATTSVFKNFASLVNNIVFLPPKSILIPDWVGVTVWALNWIYILACSLISILYGLSYERSTFVVWLTAFLLSVIQSIFVVAPLKICVFATFQTVLEKREIKNDQWTAYTGKSQRINAVVKWKQQQANEKSLLSINPTHPKQKTSEMISSSSPSYHPPFLAMIKRGKRALAVRQVKRYWYETSMWVCIAIFISALLVYQRNPNLPRINDGLVNKLRDDIKPVTTKDDVFNFLQNSLIPVVYKLNQVSMFLQFKVLGPIRLRQVRYARLRNCTCDERMGQEDCLCVPRNEELESTAYYDTRSYDGSWSTELSSRNASLHFESPFAYRQCVDLQMEIPLGSGLYRSFYPCGGYAVDLGYKSRQAYSTVNAINNSGWLDRYSAALIIEFSVIDIPSGYITPFLYIMEFIPTGGIHVFQYSNSFRQFYIYEMKDLFIIALQIVHVAICIFLVYSTLTEYSDVKWNLRAIVGILMDPWHLIQILVAVVTFTAYGYYMKHIAVAEEYSGMLKKDSSRFVSLFNPSQHRVTYVNLISVATFLSYMRLLKILRGSETAVTMLNTVAVAKDGIGNVALLISAVTIGFTLTGVISFVSTRNNFRYFPVAFVSLTSMGAGMDISHPEHGVTTELLWSIYFLLFAVFVLAFYSNLYATVISDALFFMKNEASKETTYQVETLALHWMYEKFVSLFGFKTRAFSGKAIKLRPPPGSVLNRDDIAEEMRASLTLDPEDGPTERRLLTRIRHTRRVELLDNKPKASDKNQK